MNVLFHTATCVHRVAGGKSGAPVATIYVCMQKSSWVTPAATLAYSSSDRHTLSPDLLRVPCGKVVRSEENQDFVVFLGDVVPLSLSPIKVVVYSYPAGDSSCCANRPAALVVVGKACLSAAKERSRNGFLGSF